MSGCILVKALADGYGMVTENGRNYRAHRFVYEKTKGRIPEGYVVRHLCFNRNCINLNHLELGTPQDNAQDGDRAKLTREQVSEIKQRIIDNKGESFNGFLLSLAEEYGVSKWTIKNIKQLRTWENIRPDLNNALKTSHTYSNLTNAHFDIQSRLRAAKVLLLRNKYKLSYRAIAEQVGLGYTQVCYICKGERHKSIYDWYIREIGVL